MKITYLIHKDWAKDLDFIEVVDLIGGGYDWDEFHGWYSPSRRRYFWDYGSGCSCSSWGDELYKLDDMMNGSKVDMERSLREFMDGAYSFVPSDVLDAVAQVKRFRPGKEESS